MQNDVLFIILCRSLFLFKRREVSRVEMQTGALWARKAIWHAIFPYLAYLSQGDAPQSNGMAPRCEIKKQKYINETKKKMLRDSK